MCAYVGVRDTWSVCLCRGVGHMECVPMQCIVLKAQCMIEGGRMCLAT